ncbi:MAG: hypothetical protein R3B74_14875 [Nitrospirales bacterium]
MTNMLPMSTGQIGNPMLFIILVVPNNGLVHMRLALHHNMIVVN